jgi:hypothetical protein
MSNGPVIAFAPSVFERDDLLVLALLDHFRGHLCARNQRIAMGELVAIGVHQHFAKGRGLACFHVEKIDIDRVAFRNAILPAASFNNCVTHTEKEMLRGKAAQSPINHALWQVETRLGFIRHKHDDLTFRRTCFIVGQQFGRSSAAEFFEFLGEFACDAEWSIWHDFYAGLEGFR